VGFWRFDPDAAQYNTNPYRKTYTKIKKLKRMRYFSYLLLFSVCIACLLIAGCSQPGQSGIEVQPSTPTEQVTPTHTLQQTSSQPQYVVAVTAQKQDKNIIITYQGGMDTVKLLYITVTVNEIEQSKKLGNTPGDTITLEGTTSTSNDHVVIVGHFNDGSTQTLLDLDTNKPGEPGGIYYRPFPTQDMRFREPAYKVPPYTIKPKY
jgi:hypothetical protein